MGCSSSKPKSNIIMGADDLMENDSHMSKKQTISNLRTTPAVTEENKSVNSCDKDSEASPLPQHGSESSSNNRSISPTVTPRPCPPKMCGYMAKQGQIFRTWKRRFFILERGEISYYMRESGPDSEMGEQKMGTSLLLQGYSVVIEDDDKLLISVPGRAFTISDSSSSAPSGGTRGRAVSTVESSTTGKTRVMLLEPESPEELARWIDAINEHIDYCNNRTSI